MRKLIVIALLTLANLAWADSVAVKIRTLDGKTLETKRTLENVDNFGRLTLPRKWLEATNAATVEVVPDFASARAGEEGYYVFPNGILGKFKERKDDAYSLSRLPLALSGMRIGESAFAAVIKSGRFECSIAVSLKKGLYKMYHKFDYTQTRPYEDIVIDYYFLTGKDANYSGMARIYRAWQLERKEVVPLKERVKKSPELAYAARAPEVRIRQGWKPVPSPVPEQDFATEPPMKAMVTFDRVGDIVDEFKAQGVDRAQLCLVGWNIRGHDGRWPTAFPVEQSLGGEVKLRGLISKVKADGYQIVCHTNSSDAYRVSPDWSESDAAKKFDGTLVKGGKWSGGNMYHLCFEQSYYKFTTLDLPKIADLGFRGLHYIDVISTISPVPCFDKNHPINASQAADYSTLMLDCAARNFGGAASEGGYDHVASRLDYALYVTFDLTKKTPSLRDEYVPIWHLVYNGIILSNAATETINFTIKPIETSMKMVEYACRPSFYFYSAFLDNGKNWMGTEDLRCGTDAELKSSVAAVKKGCDLLEETGYLQFEFFDSHEEISAGVFKSVFSDGTEIICNYTDEQFEYKKSAVGAKSYRIFKPALLKQLVDIF